MGLRFRLRRQTVRWHQSLSRSASADHMISRSFPTVIAPLVFVCLWATGFVGARLGMPHSEPGTFLAIRFGSACILLAVVAWVFKAKWPKGANAGHAIIIGFLIHGIYLGSVFWAIDRGMPAGVSRRNRRSAAPA